jgi:methionine synthase I (cobalamin-dependent)/5,10-methylenetetrahydrofolate reductase
MSETVSWKSLAPAGEPLLADGAMGTMLHQQGARFASCFDALNLTQPTQVFDVHRGYIEAGSRLIETNSFGANRYKLAEHGLEDQLAQINAAAVQLARQAARLASHPVLVAGSLGPLGVRLAPFGRVKPEQAFAAYRQQIAALLEAGIDLLVIETQIDLHEARQALRAARSLAEIPVLVSMTYTRDDRTLLGDSPGRVAGFLSENGADIIGANCSGGPAQLLRVLEQMRRAVPGRQFAVMPNAGWPERVAGRIMYPATADYFGDYALAFCQAGAAIIGGCCGTTPQHIAAMRQALDRTGEPCLAAAMQPEINGTEPQTRLDTQPTRLAARLAEGRFVIAVEMDPPRGFATQKLLAGASLLADAGADAINVADSPMARMRMSPWAACQLIQEKVGVESVLHFPTRGRNLLRIQGDLLAAHALGVRNVFIVMGDPTAIGDYPEAADNFDLVPTGLIRLIKQGFNSGVDQSGAEIGEATSFFVGCALNLAARDPAAEMCLLRKKIEAGADFTLTQPIYDASLVRNFLGRYRSEFGALEIPLIVGVLPLHNARHATFLHNEVPGIEIPPAVLRRFEKRGDDPLALGRQLAIELLEELSGVAQGTYLIPAFGRFEHTAEVIDALAFARPTRFQPPR